MKFVLRNKKNQRYVFQEKSGEYTLLTEYKNATKFHDSKFNWPVISKSLQKKGHQGDFQAYQLIKLKS
jgi:predicted GNAT family acetyltransferase